VSPTSARFGQTIAHIFLNSALALALLPVAGYTQGEEFISIRGENVNVRAQPDKKSDLRWTLDSGYPLQVEQRQGQWLKVRDHEESLGWVFAPLTSATPHRLVTGHSVNLRAGPGPEHRVLGKLEQAEVLRTVDNQGEWVQVQRSDGQRGWVAKRFTWGW